MSSLPRPGLPDRLIQDVRFALRQLYRDRGFTLAALLVLGLGLGVNHMFLTIVYAHTMRGLKVPRPERLLFVSTVDDRAQDQPMSYPDVMDLHAATRTFETLIAFSNVAVTIADEGRAPERFDASYVGQQAFPTVGARPLLGHDFTPEDHEPGAPPVMLLGHTAWRARYGEDSSIVGRTALVNGTPTTIVGVMPDASGFPSPSVVWLPLEQLPGLTAQSRSNRSLRVFGRLRDDVAVAVARAEVASVMARLAARHPESNQRVRARVVPINERLLLPIEGPWLAFLLAGFTIVVASCANVGNLLLARGFHRTREVAVRATLGASRARLVRERLVEALVLALFGAGLGLAVSVAGVRLFSSAIPSGTLPYWLDYSIDWRVFAALVVVSTVSAIAFGLIPALLASRADANAVLKDGGRSGTASRVSRPWMAGFLAVEVALAVVLLATMTVGTLSLRSGVPSDGVIRAANVVTAAVTLPAARYPTPEARARFFDALLDRVHALPGVEAASLTTALPLAGAPERPVEIEGRTWPDGTGPTTRVVDVGPRYFETLSIPLLGGRDFVPADDVPDAAGALVNERFVERFFPGDDALGRRVALPALDTASAPPVWLTIVGIVPDVRQQTRIEPDPVVYLPAVTRPPVTLTLVVRSKVAPATMAVALRAAAQAVDASVPLYRVRSLRQALWDAEWNPRVSARLAITLTVLCVLFAAVGLYAVAAHLVSLRQREFGIRVALGATPRRIVTLVVKSLRVPLGLGLALGIGGALAWDRAFPSGRPDLAVSDPLVLAATLLAVALVTLAACFRPARRAARLDPSAVLRQE